MAKPDRIHLHTVPVMSEWKPLQIYFNLSCGIHWQRSKHHYNIQGQHQALQRITVKELQRMRQHLKRGGLKCHFQDYWGELIRTENHTFLATINI